MSGPKISVYDLTGWARSVVMGQIRCEQESVRCADQITGFLREGHCLENSVETTKQRLLLLQKRTGEGAEHIKTIEEVLLRADKELCNARDELNANMPHISEKYVISEEAYEQKKQQLARIKKIKDTIVTTINELNSTLSDKQYGSLETANRIEESIAEDLSGVLSFYIPIEDESAQFDEEKQLLNQKLMEMLAQDHPDYVRQKIRNAVSALARIYDSTHLATFKKVTFQRLVAEIETCENERRQKESIFSEMVERYRILCQMAEEEVYLYDLSAFEQLENEIDRLEQIIYKKQAQEYISDCVDEVLSEMGYDLIGSRDVKKRNGKRFRNELYTFNEGTAVNITYSADGQISMELGGLSFEDRIPTNEETDILTQDMETFCSKFSEFERRLYEKGVVVGERIDMCPPTAEYATIINVNDYQLEADKSITQIATNERKKKAAEKKYLQRDK